jgi:hypothetical protein
VAGCGLGDLGRLVGGTQLLGRGEDGAEDRQSLGWIRRRQIIECDHLRDRGEAGEVRVDLDGREVGDDEEWRVLKRVLVVDQLAEGGAQIATLALVLEGEEAALPDVREPVTAAELLGPLLERVPLASGVGVGGAGLAEDAA